MLPLLQKFIKQSSPCQHLSISQQQTAAKPLETNWSFKAKALTWPLVHLSYVWLALPWFIRACSPQEQSLLYQLYRSAALFSYMPPAEWTAAPTTFTFFSNRDKGSQKVSSLPFTVTHPCIKPYTPSIGVNPTRETSVGLCSVCEEDN